MVGITALLVLSASRISFVEDISSFLPNNADNKRINEAYQHIGAANKIIVRFEICDMRQEMGDNVASRTSHIENPDLLTDAATRFAEILQQSDSAGHIKDLMCEIDNEKISEVANFITQNLPFFLEEADYARIDSLIQPQNIESQLKADKELLMSPMGGFVREVILRDPLHFSQNALKNLEIFKQNDNYNTDNGFIFNKKGECIVTITSNYPVSETANNKLLANEIYSAVRQTVGEFNGEVKIVPFGAALVSITNAEQIKNDSIFAVSIALILILALLFYFFRNLKSLFYIAVSVLFGALFSLGVMVIFNPTVSIIAIGISSIIFGIAINYPLHFLAHNQHATDTRRTLREIVNPLLIGNITTVGAFLSLLFISSPAMHDLGLFSALLLVGTIVFVLIFLPQMIDMRFAICDLRQGTSDARQSQIAYRKSHVFSRLAEFSPEKNKFIVLIFLVFTVVLFFFSFGTKFETNLQSINYMTDEQRTEMNKLIAENQGKGKTLYVVAEGITFEGALWYNNYVVVPMVENLAKDSLIIGYSGIGKYFLPSQIASGKIGLWTDFWKNKKDKFINDFNEIAQKQSFNKNVFDDFIDILNAEYGENQLDAYCYDNKLNDIAENYISKTEDNNFIYTIVQCKPEQIENIKAKINSQLYEDDSVFTFDDTSIATKMVNALSDDFNNVLYICAFIVFVFLFFSFGKIELAILTFIPMAVGWVWILGLMNIFDLKFNIVNIILATFIFGQGDDYTIFVTEGLMYEYTYRKKMLASFKNSIILSATILFIAIGMLIFAKHPAMRSLAQLTIVGMVSVVACAYLFPPLIFRFLTTKKGKVREVPWTLKRFAYSCYAFFFFLMGSLITTIYGFILFGICNMGYGICDLRYATNCKSKIPSRKSHIEHRKSQFHKHLQWFSEFVIKRVPGTKFRYENLSNETFEKPAVIISNHQSHLDLMCLLMLTPKLIILTNDWVWRNPFYGKIIRYAEFYPVSNGIENAIPQLEDAVSRGYSIVIFPEGTRSMDCSIGRFHRGAFFLAEKLGLDIVPVFLHGVGQVLPKNDFLLREGQITVQVRERIAPDKTIDYAARTKQIRKYYTETFAEISKEIETPDYFKSFVLHNYMYKGVEVWRGAKAEMRLAMCDKRYEICDMRQATNDVQQSHIAHRTSHIVIKNNGYGIQSLMFALANKNTQVIAIEEDEEKVAIARNCAGVPQNLKIYHTTEWENTSSS
jgi:1-acyl-sn-glycerol-3-phosphate acyltransferase